MGKAADRGAGGGVVPGSNALPGKGLASPELSVIVVDMNLPTDPELQRLADLLELDALQRALREDHGGFDHVDHWQQGEFHHDHILRVKGGGLPGPILVIATNCNGSVKEVICLAEVPGRWALWGWRVPENPEFEPGALTPLAVARSWQWFDPRRLLTEDTRSELLPEFRRRQRGGGWTKIDSGDE